MAKKAYVYDGSAWVEITSQPSVATGTTTSPGIVQLTDSVSSTSTSTAATPNSVKTAYDLANTPASTTTAGKVQLTDSTSSTSTTTAATPNSVKSTYDYASGKVAKAGDTITGQLTVSNTASVRGYGSTATGASIFSTAVDSDANNRLGIRPDGEITWGDGTNARDTNLYRSAANTLKTDDSVIAPQVTITGGDGTTGTDTASLNLIGYNQRGGTGYHGFLDVKNTYGSATNPKKFFRLNSTGGIEVVNNAYGAVIMSLSDGGQLTVPSISVSSPVYGSYNKGGTADTTTITTAGTYYALTNAEVSFTPQFVGQRFLLAYTAYASLNTTTIQYAFVQANITDSSNVDQGSLGFSRADNFGTSGRGGTVALTKIWTSDTTATRKFKLYGTTQTTNGLILSLAYTQMTVMSLN